MLDYTKDIDSEIFVNSIRVEKFITKCDTVNGPIYLDNLRYVLNVIAIPTMNKYEIVIKEDITLDGNVFNKIGVSNVIPVLEFSGETHQIKHDHTLEESSLGFLFHYIDAPKISNGIIKLNKTKHICVPTEIAPPINIDMFRQIRLIEKREVTVIISKDTNTLSHIVNGLNVMNSKSIIILLEDEIPDVIYHDVVVLVNNDNGDGSILMNKIYGECKLNVIRL